MFLLALFLAVAAPVPTGVNDTVLGNADAFKVQGPARVCLNSISVDLMADETAYLSYAGIHNGELEVHGPRGLFRISESEIYKDGGAKGRAEMATDTTIVYWDRQSADPTYALFLPSDRSQRVANVTGSAVTGARSDKWFLSRIGLSENSPTGCSRTFRYGWDEILGLSDTPKRRAGESK